MGACEKSDLWIMILGLLENWLVKERSPFQQSSHCSGCTKLKEIGLLIVEKFEALMVR